jgi:hypothetical protein
MFAAPKLYCKNVFKQDIVSELGTGIKEMKGGDEVCRVLLTGAVSEIERTSNIFVLEALQK